ncbi:hypothetical protein BD410DRAFT_786995 [Rickenella mellea]|uniref:Flavin reductase like domain-containing protein n=1 Tax=Rickenella mellea TaxID=50990 RepID=A0A4Y7Q8Q6_9AGAM|nr:hypothetical protein BD410DRAFT_786995 [Rickenella mellea]
MLVGAVRHRLLTTYPRRLFSADASTKNALRVLLRETAQSVAVVTTILPTDASHFHGATLSSFTSIAMDPHPLVAFSLRIPSRMAAALQLGNPRSEHTPNMVVNILSSSQSTTAVHFSRPDLYPEPFRLSPHILSKEGIPILAGSLGALSCNLIQCISLHGLRPQNLSKEANEDVDAAESREDGVLSELFIARVLRVESLEGHEPAQRLPLLYHHRQYATAHPLESGQN